jgi:tRNA(Ile)-lysidine synthase
VNWRQTPVVVDCLSRCRFPATPDVTCAVSGGADSLALLALAVAANKKVTAIHIDHGLRPGSASEANLVRECASFVGATFVARTVSVESGANVEARARSARYAALPSDVLTGHTADDRAETVIINLLRGAGIDGLTGIRQVGGPSGTVVHPLLELRRRDTEAICAAMGWTPLHDPSNDDESLLRNRVRHSILPMLNEAAGRDLAPILARQGDLLAADSDVLEVLSAEIDPTDARALAVAPPALARRAIRRWLTVDHPPDSASVERVLAVARGEAVACEIPGGARVQRTNQRLSITPPPDQD